MEGLSAAAVAWCAATLALAGTVKGITGIGIPLVSISLLPFVLTIPQAVALLPVPIVMANLWQALAGGYLLLTCRRHAPLLLAMATGTVIGGGLLAGIDQPLLMVILGAVVLVFAASELSRLRLRVPLRHHRAAGATVGLAGGVLGGMSSMFGPPILMFLVSLELPKEEFVGTVSSIYLLAGLMLGATLAAYGVAGPAEFGWSALATLPLFAGLMLGQRARRHVSERLFRKALLVLLLLIGANLVRRGLG